MAGYVSYEAGYGLVGLDDPPALPYPLAVLGVYEEPLRFDHLSGRIRGAAAEAGDFSAADATSVPPPKSRPAASPHPMPVFGIDYDEYATRVERVLEYLRAGDCYQINLTDAFEFPAPPDLMSLYRRLRRAQPTSYGAFLDLAGLRAASFSPELHFAILDGVLLARPMKGTSARGRTLAEDLERRTELAGDEKNRAENVMIVDLLRNDLGRLCRYGSVTVPQLFEVRPYGRVLQMTSTVRGELAGRPNLGEVFAKLFPSGSVTGAPKRRAMEIIRELESRPRGLYTGAIGYATPAGDMTFSVAIRTVVSYGHDASGGHDRHPERTAIPGRLPAGTEPPDTAHRHLAERRPPSVLGAGSGIVIDSAVAEEYRECLLKGAFLGESGDRFALFETMRCEAGAVRSANRHLDRLEASAAYFGFPFDRAEAKRLLLAHCRDGRPSRLRLDLRHDGRLEAKRGTLDELPGELRVALAEESVNSSDPFLFHKTTRRARHDRAMALARRHRLADLIFRNERDELTEGAISNLFVELDGELLTPPIRAGLLPGVGRSEILAARPEAREAVLRPDDLGRATAIYLCSSLRGLRRVRLFAGAAVGDD